MMTLSEKNLFNKIWNVDKYQIINKTMISPKDVYKCSQSYSRKYFKNKKIIRFAFVCPNHRALNHDELLKEFRLLCKKFGISGSVNQTFYLDDKSSTYTCFPD